MAHTPSEDEAGAFPPHPLRQYALLADGERGILVGPRGDFAWMCAPRWDSDAVFSSLIGGSGSYAITPHGRFVWGGYYEDGTLIWRSRWTTEDGVVECREALAFPGDPHRAIVLRRVVAQDTDAWLTVFLEPCAGFDQHPLKDLTHDGAGVWTGRTGDLYVRWSGSPQARPAGTGDRRLSLDLSLPKGAHQDFVLEISDRSLPGVPPDPGRAWEVTQAAWRDQVPALDHTVATRDARHAYTVLRGLTGRNYDYRYVWIRDQCYAGHAVAAAGGHALLDDAVRFTTARLLDDGPALAPAYRVDGRPIPDQHRLDLPGYPGGFDLVGNHVSRQFQLDAFGEALLLFADAARHDRLDPDGWRAARVGADAIARRWSEPDAGVWELAPRPWAHSRLICAAGLRALAGAPGAGKRQSADWSAPADRLVAHTSANSLHSSGRWQRSPDDPGLDGALLLPPIRGALPADDPRTVATLHAYTEQLTGDHFAYRFRHDDRHLGAAEGAFLLCGFVTALAEHQQGHETSAYRWFERNRAACGPPGLFSEEYDVAQRQMRGNLPQAFVHALMLECAARFAEPWHQGCCT
ncbi:glycoside hydrolase family 15 protein [Streptantibioticus parmotrematis]|uniref:glycoside hydrolase family 15 protein n=1 Tax=Streptantibioticus parmotrematis TaxID=2873249 RepID=UPI0033D10277